MKFAFSLPVLIATLVTTLSAGAVEMQLSDGTMGGYGYGYETVCANEESALAVYILSHWGRKSLVLFPKAERMQPIREYAFAAEAPEDRPLKVPLLIELNAEIFSVTEPEGKIEYRTRFEIQREELAVSPEKIEELKSSGFFDREYNCTMAYADQSGLE
jgi:hypothetical protein